MCTFKNSVGVGVGDAYKSSITHLREFGRQTRNLDLTHYAYTGVGVIFGETDVQPSRMRRLMRIKGSLVTGVSIPCACCACKYRNEGVPRFQNRHALVEFGGNGTRYSYRKDECLP